MFIVMLLARPIAKLGYGKDDHVCLSSLYVNAVHMHLELELYKCVSPVCLQIEPAICSEHSKLPNH